MPEQVFYIRGRFPFERGVSSELVSDARLVLDLQPGQIKALAAELEAFPGFLDKETLKGIVDQYEESEDRRKRLTNLITGTDARLRQADQTVNDLLSGILEWQKSEENQKLQLLSVQEMEELQRRLPLLTRPYQGLRRQGKARRLTEATGFPLEDVEIICDLRPVFDEERKDVEGIIPYTIMKVVGKGSDGFPLSLEVVLTETDVNDLAKKAAAAVEKLKRLRDLLAAKELPP